MLLTILRLQHINFCQLNYFGVRNVTYSDSRFSRVTTLLTATIAEGV